MRFKGAITKGLLLALILTLVPITAFSAQKITPGSACKVYKQKVNYQNKTYTCIKSGMKLVWNKGVVVKKPTPAPTYSPSPVLKQTDVLDPKYPKQGEPCPRNSKDVIGYDSKGKLVDLMCNQFNDQYYPRPENLNPFQVDQKTGERIRDLSKSDININFNDIVYKPTPFVTANPKSPLTSSLYFANLDSCRLVDGDPKLTNMSIGFPIPEKRLDPRKPINLQILPVDFLNVKSTASPKDDFGKVLGDMVQFWESQSSTGMDIDIRLPDSYLRINQTVESFDLSTNLSNFKFENYGRYIQYVIDQ